MREFSAAAVEAKAQELHARECACSFGVTDSWRVYAIEALEADADRYERARTDADACAKRYAQALERLHAAEVEVEARRRDLLAAVEREIER